MAATMTNPFVATMDARRLGENGAPELSAAGVGEPLVALFFKLVRNLPEASLEELMAAVDKKDTADLIVLAYQTRASDARDG